ncbi:MAG: AAA family ATPase, partial [Elusimicrobiales bacterium]|nr:AAA family ATPase [Elusimicrobiales bacterium]
MAMNENFDRVKFALGVSEFSEIIDSSCYYCDKTLLIKDLIDNKSKVMLFTRPRRFGKTLNMTMLRTFFEKPIDGKDTGHYFKNLKIWQQGEKYRAEQGKRPIIYITLKDVQFLSYEDSIAAIWMVISEEFDRHSYLEKSPKLNKENLAAFKGLRSKQGNLAFSLKILAKLLQIHHGITPLILIDEYD